MSHAVFGNVFPSLGLQARESINPQSRRERREFFFGVCGLLVWGLETVEFDFASTISSGVLLLTLLFSEAISASCKWLN